MMGTYRVLKDEGVAFYELITISEEDGTLILRLKHFHSDLTGWEERDEVVTFPLVKLGPTDAYLDGMTFRRSGEDKLEVFVRRRSDEGGPSVLAFPYDRVR